MMRILIVSFAVLLLSACQTRTATAGKIVIPNQKDIVTVTGALKEEFARLGFRPDGIPAPGKDTIAFFSGGNLHDQVYLQMIARGHTVSLYFNPRSPTPADEAAAADVAQKIQHFLAERFPAYPCDLSSGPKLYTSPNAWP